MLTNYKLYTIIAVILVFVFYWMVIRPSNIRSKCSEKASEESVTLVNEVGGTFEQDTAVRTQKQETLEAQLYASCLHENGL